MAQPLSSDDRRFFSVLARIIFTNPFGEERAEVEALASAGEVPTHRDAGGVGEHHFGKIVPALDARIEKLEGRGLGRLDKFSGTDRTLLEHAYLFQIFHLFVDDLDRLIRTQLERGNEPAPAPFAKDLIARLGRRGFAEADALRYAGLFYQLRRAYYFIARSLVGDSPCMRELRLSLWSNVFTQDVRTYDRHLWNRMEDFSTLLLGETGTGKGSAAAAIGRSGYIPFDPKTGRFTHSFTQSFIAINLSQFPETLIESELFGHRKGAFTGAIENHQGVLERCQPHGALFVDEIGDVSTHVQIKLLQVLQERTFTPIGSHTEKRFSGRVIAATNRPILALRRQGNFRDDFFYRLCSDVITVPPLRRRIAESPAELEQLVRLLVQRMTGEPSADLVTLVLEVLERDVPRDYSWPGNVRELEQAVRRILLTRRYEVDLQAVTGDDAAFAERLRSGRLSARDLLGRYCRLLYERHGSYEEVARRTELDRRTVKKYLQGHA
ncbi:MAG: sigma-54-dependent Fis family transcriptional regulator [Gammaproteobacteria bacterium]|nr:sigma-54-dependent Fis family transcriptional regulator [Gammaproteobacteria bacterium]NIR84424.1 sigma-54-dependent Fis family transcriptional regulator [Gammaproteobacteria bacterium]NIR90905.1 sigma-54-dependent Fis family transcriptional regulator [Gammaproteobacteria bacterium]NIU07091.1 sigma-54-dependent Fis family transcriptional regulator [Gammaproteobacteria bacterium]NIV76220.1 sigma-54-dependent Fis family transcriptional regulator [Gammaproteobacteria bacterium]